MDKTYIPFTKEMKKDYTILAPNMLPMHFKLILQVLKNYGYKIDLLDNQGKEVIETGLKYVHNDTCYPAILVIGQFIHAIKSGKYNPDKTALIYFQTGGGCRASNYISLLRKALEKAEYGNIPVISFSFSSIERHPGFKPTLPIVHKMFYALLYGDLLMSLVNQCKPYEIEKGKSEKLANEFCERIADSMNKEGISFKKLKREYVEILNAFDAIPKVKTEKVKVGIVGEIYVKFSPFGNNNLAQFLVDEGAEVIVPGLLDFFMYSLYNTVEDAKLYGRGKWLKPFTSFAFKYLQKKQIEMINIIKTHGKFSAPTPIGETIAGVRDYIGLGTKMGEGWLLPAEMLELYHSGVQNIVCTQPFGCLPNHICGKGMMKPLKERNPGMNIVAIDYDAGATKVNQENRIKLMLSSAREKLEEQKSAEKTEKQTEKEPVTV